MRSCISVLRQWNAAFVWGVETLLGVATAVARTGASFRRRGCFVGSRTERNGCCEALSGSRRVPSLFAFFAGLLFCSEITGAERGVVASPEDRIIRDTTDDGLGNSLGNAADTIARVGEAPGADDADSRYYLPFGPLTPDEVDAIARAPDEPGAILLNLSLGTKSNVTNVVTEAGAVDLYVDVYGFNNRVDAGADVDDYHSNEMTLLFGRGVKPNTPNGWLSFDVTSFVKQEIAAGSSVLAFRLQIDPPDALPNADGQPNRYLFHTADHATNKPFLEVSPPHPVAELLGSEGFNKTDYPGGIVVGANAVVSGFEGPWRGTSVSSLQLGASSLTYPGYTDLSDGTSFAAGNRRISVDANSNFNRRLLTGNNGPLGNFATPGRRIGASQNGDPLYFAFVMRMTSHGDTPPVGSFSIYNGGDSGEDRVFRIAYLEEIIDTIAGDAEAKKLSARNGETNLFIVRLDFTPRAEKIEVWVNPDIDGAPAADAVFHEAIEFDRMGITFFRPPGAAGELDLDEFRIGTSWSGVTRADLAATLPAPVAAPSEAEHRMQAFPPSPRGDDVYPFGFYPFIDRFGQYRHLEWEDKIRDEDHLSARTAEELEELDALQPPARNRYGGWSHGPRLYATGYFRTGKYAGKWWLVDPEGHLFFSNGITTVGSVVRTERGALSSQKTGVTGREYFFADFPRATEPATDLGLYADEPATVTSGHYHGTRPRAINFFAANALLQFSGVTTLEELRSVTTDLALDRLRSWGFNTVAGWSDATLEIHPERLPYTPVLFPALPPAILPGSVFPDFFREEYAENVREILLEEAGATLGDPWNIGYFIHNEPDWAKSTVADIDIGLAALQSDRMEDLDRYAKQVFVELMQSRYSSIWDLNEVWGSDYLTWEEMLDRTDIFFDVAAVTNDLVAFAVAYAEEYFRTNRDAVREVASNHLYLGCRFTSGVILRPEMSRAAARFSDVYSINRYAGEVGVFEGMEADVPMMLTEYATWTTDTGLFGPALGPQRSEAARPGTFGRQLQSAIEHPRYVGAHWFQYYDFPAGGRLTRANNNSNYGFVQATNTPYRDMVDAARELNYAMYELRSGAAVAAPCADAYVEAGDAANKNFGGKSYLKVGNNVESTRRQTFLRFGLCTLAAPVDRAILLLHPIEVSGSPVHNLAEVWDDSWEETTLTWNTRTEKVGKKFVSWTPVSARPVEVDVTRQVNAALAAGRELSLVVFQEAGTGLGLYGSRQGTEERRPGLRLVPGATDLETWRKRYFPPGVPESADDADPSGDGVANLLKYALGLNPVLSSTHGLPEVLRDEEGRFRIGFFRARSDIVYRVEASSDLQSWDSVAIDPGRPGEKVTVKFSAASDKRARFFRLIVERM